MWEALMVLVGVVALWSLGAAFGWLIRDSTTATEPPLHTEAPRDVERDLAPLAAKEDTEVDEVLASFARKPFRLAVWWNDIPPSGFASEYRH